jgi:peptidoglycan/xylan/chitin deacetylase (PgdA/CDA1 family)
MPFRLDRFLTLQLHRLRPRAYESRSLDRIPILMYHSVSNQSEDSLHPYYRTVTAPEQFAAQIEQLHQLGYRTASPAEAVRQLHSQEKVEGAEKKSQKKVVLTFDDGYRDFLRHAFPVLQKYGFSAIVYLPTAYIEDAPAIFKGKECLTWSEVRELHGQGIHFGSHTVTHPQLHELSRPRIQEEITNSKHTIEDKLGSRIDSFAYPYAFPQTDTCFTNMLRDQLNAAGYENGVCTTIGRTAKTSDPLFLERLPVNGCDDPELLKAKLDGAYDWVRTAQNLSKSVKQKLGRPKAAKYSLSKDFTCSS